MMCAMASSFSRLVVVYLCAKRRRGIYWRKKAALVRSFYSHLGRNPQRVSRRENVLEPCARRWPTRMKPLGPLLELGLVLLGDRGGRSDSNCPMPLEHGASHERATTIAHDPVGTLLWCP